MKIYIAMIHYLYDNDVEVSTHLTRKGALMEVIKRMTEDLCSGLDEDELKEHLSAMPHHPEEDLMSYSSEQLARKFNDWLEYNCSMNDHMTYEWYETEVQA